MDDTDLGLLDKSLAEAMGWSVNTSWPGWGHKPDYPDVWHGLPRYSTNPVAAKELMEYLRTEGYYHEIRWHPGDGLYTAVVCLAPAYGRDEAGSWTVALARAALAAIRTRNEATRRSCASER